MHTILTTTEAITKSKALRLKHKTIVLAGGCFDILHIGHIAFLRNAKEKGDILFVFLESDQRITELKGQERPIHTQQARADVLASLRFVDFVILLPHLTNDADYATLVAQIHPDIIAVTEHDGHIQQKKDQAASIKAEVMTVTRKIPNASTSRLAQILEKEE